MNITELLTVIVPTGGVIAAYFKLSSQLEKELTKKNHEQDLTIKALQGQIDANKMMIGAERNLTVEQQKGIIKRVKYKLLAQDTKIENVIAYLKTISRRAGLPDWQDRESQLEINIMQDLMRDDEILSGDLNSETLS